ncbi:H/ACA ribonucleoprotein complex non-core subunit NAF1-like isoform X2 [Physella acuta]|uniref:H/ACA ribonucleoprotein complex non-core subunit NAF1-like isoform X2 n=1 Tax=Physella acuta TaxID=109671 RepID=UPI0027DCB9D9|nr:H/ACA ribonucleoprotein complex non-core subunit NAF1-like isoform X2 [Physella acuta]
MTGPTKESHLVHPTRVTQETESTQDSCIAVKDQVLKTDDYADSTIESDYVTVVCEINGAQNFLTPNTKNDNQFPDSSEENLTSLVTCYNNVKNITGEVQVIDPKDGLIVKNLVEDANITDSTRRNTHELSLTEDSNITIPTEDTNITDPTEDTNITDPTDDTQRTDLTEDSNITDPTEDTNITDPTEDTNIAEPTEDTNIAEPTEDTNIADPTEDTNTAESTEDTQRTDLTEDTNITEPTEETNITDTTKDTKRTDLTEDTNITDLTEDTNIAESTEDTNIAESTEDTLITDLTEVTNITDPTKDVHGLDLKETSKTDSAEVTYKTGLTEDTHGTDTEKIDSSVETQEITNGSRVADLISDAQKKHPIENTNVENALQDINGQEVIEIKKEVVDNDYDSSCVIYRSGAIVVYSDSSSSDSDGEELLQPQVVEKPTEILPTPKCAITRTEGEVLPQELPPIEYLTISPGEEVSLELVGAVSGIVDVLVVVKAKFDSPALYDDTVLFLKGRQPLGLIFETFGTVERPFYSVRFNRPEDIEERNIHIGDEVFYAPKADNLTKYVFISELKKLKYNDASWEYDNEPPPTQIEFSDDEEEKKAKQRQRNKARGIEGQSDETPRQMCSKKKRKKAFVDRNQARLPSDQTPGLLQGDLNKNPFGNKSHVYNPTSWPPNRPPLPDMSVPPPNFRQMYPPAHFGQMPDWKSIPGVFNNGPRACFSGMNVPPPPAPQPQFFTSYPPPPQFFPTYPPPQFSNNSNHQSQFPTQYPNNTF